MRSTNASTLMMHPLSQSQESLGRDAVWRKPRTSRSEVDVRRPAWLTRVPGTCRWRQPQRQYCDCCSAVVVDGARSAGGGASLRNPSDSDAIGFVGRRRPRLGRRRPVTVPPVTWSAASKQPMATCGMRLMNGSTEPRLERLTGSRSRRAHGDQCRRHCRPWTMDQDGQAEARAARQVDVDWWSRWTPGVDGTHREAPGR